MEQKKNTMKPKEIQDLIDYISNTGLAEVKIKTEEFELSVKHTYQYLNNSFYYKTIIKKF